MRTYLIIFVLVPLYSNACSDHSVSTSNWRNDYLPNEIMLFENFSTNELNQSVWENEINMNGGYNGEFQIYVNSSNNTYLKNLMDSNGSTVVGRALHLKPTLVNETYGNNFLYDGALNLEGCTDPNGKKSGQEWVCSQQGTWDLVLPPCFSSRVRTKGRFSFTYGRLEIFAKLPVGDWLWPAMWLLPEENAYGEWPLSGEIDLMESRGNKVLNDNDADHTPIGTEQFATTLHFGFDWSQDGWSHAHKTYNSPPNKGFHLDFHNYTMVWSPDGFQFYIDGNSYYNITPPEAGFFTPNYGFMSPAQDNPWNKTNTTKNHKMAPFDQPFHLILNVAVGGIYSYFPPKAKGPPPCEEPRSSIWYTDDQFAKTQYWERREKWYPSWLEKSAEDAVALKIENITIYAL